MSSAMTVITFSWDRLGEKAQRVAVIAATMMDLQYHWEEKDWNQLQRRKILSHRDHVSDKELAELVDVGFLRFVEATQTYHFTSDEIRAFCLAKMKEVSPNPA